MTPLKMEPEVNPRFSKFSDVSSIPEKKRDNTGVDVLARIIEELEEDHEAELRNCKKSM